MFGKASRMFICVYYITIILFTHKSLLEKFWEEPVNRREFFENFAKARNFEPLIAANWYNVSHADLRPHKVKL